MFAKDKGHVERVHSSLGLAVAEGEKLGYVKVWVAILTMPRVNTVTQMREMRWLLPIVKGDRTIGGARNAVKSDAGRKSSRKNGDDRSRSTLKTRSGVLYV
jgi:hypothetical protein